MLFPQIAILIELTVLSLTGFQWNSRFVKSLWTAAGIFNNNNQQRTNLNFPPPAANTVPPVPSGLGNTPPQNAPCSNPSNPQKTNNNQAWLNTYDQHYSLQVDMDIKNVTSREEDTNKKTRMYV